MQREQRDVDCPRDLRQEVAEGLLYAHQRANVNTQKALESTSFLYALIELMSEKGLIGIEELDERKRIVGKRLADKYKQDRVGAMLQEPEQDKYTFQDGTQIDCESRIDLCHAACCRLPFALSEQDIREGVVRWNLGQPYMIDQAEDGYCCHMKRSACSCTIYENRPLPCRGYDCRKDDRIWLDFEQRIPNPEIRRPDWPGCLAAEQENRAAEEGSENGDEV